jgi:N-acetylmuramoyl-L-alanine amidase
MRTKLQAASGIAVAATLFTALVGAAGSGVHAQAAEPDIASAIIQIPSLAEPTPQESPANPAQSDQAVPSPQAETEQVARAASLADHVRAQPRSAALDSQLRCLAGAIYFEARGESLAGQLAVGRVVVDRSRSGRFPASYCGVVFQRSQFSFVRGQAMPSVSESTEAWHKAVAVARIADEGTWQSPTQGALFFHTARVSPGWRLKRLAKVDNHIFYR